MITLTVQGENLQEIIANLHFVLSGVQMKGQSAVLDATQPEPVAAVAAPVAAMPPAMAPVAVQQPAPANVTPFPVAPPTAAPVTPPAPVQPTVYAQPVPAPVPTQAPTYSQEDIMRAAAALMDAGKAPLLQQAMAELGVTHFGMLPQERYGEFALKLKAMGAQL